MEAPLPSIEYGGSGDIEHDPAAEPQTAACGPEKDRYDECEHQRSDIMDDCPVGNKNGTDEKGSTRDERKWIVAGIIFALISAFFILICLNVTRGSSKRPLHYQFDSNVDILSEVCSVENIASEQGYIACEMACQVAECCKFPATLDISCIANNETSCLAYRQHCAILDGYETTPLHTLDEQETIDTNTNNISFFTPPPALNNLDEICSYESLTKERGYLRCERECSVASCCYEQQYNVFTAANSSQEQQSCSSHPNCEGYTPCFAMAAVSTIDKQIEVEVDRKCTPSNLLTENGAADCTEACTYSTCCFDDKRHGSCPTFLDQESDLFESYCHQYQSCANLDSII